MSASAYHYKPAEDRNGALKDKIIALAQGHRRYGAGMIYLKLRQAGDLLFGDTYSQITTLVERHTPM